jgi:hypothetical protein
MESSLEARKKVLEEGIKCEQSKNYSRTFVLILIFISLSWIGCALIFYSSNTGKLEDKGNYGDAFGSLNTLFSGFALAGVIYALLLQNKSLRLQNMSLDLARIEQEQSEESLNMQINEMKDQTEMQQRPFLVAHKSSEQSEYLSIRNVGNGTAINACVCITERGVNIEKAKFSSSGSLSIIPKDIEITTDVLFHAQESVYIEYENVSGKIYFSLVEVHENTCRVIQNGPRTGGKAI